MKKILTALIVVTLIACMLCAAACTNTPAADGKNTEAKATAQETVVARAEAKAAATPDYTFDFVDEGNALVQAREGDADRYIACTAEGESKLVYVYDDICYDESKTYRYFDVLMPTAKEKIAADTPVFVYLHGGGWVSGSRKQDEKYLLSYIASTGVVVVTVEYALWFGFNQHEGIEKGISYDDANNAMDMLNRVLRNETPVSVFDQQDDIHTCLTYLRDVYLPSVGLTPKAIGIGGYSAGAHLTALYAYRSVADSPIPLGYYVDIAGPVHMLNSTYRYWGELTAGQISAEEDPEGAEAAEDILFLVQPLLSDLAGPLAAILGEEEPIDASTDEGFARAMEGTKRVSPYEYLTANSLPTAMCYASQHEEVFNFLEPLFKGKYDDFIPLVLYIDFEAKLTELGVVHTNILFEDQTHLTIGHEQAPCKWIAVQVATYAEIYCK